MCTVFINDINNDHGQCQSSSKLIIYLNIIFRGNGDRNGLDITLIADFFEEIGMWHLSLFCPVMDWRSVECMCVPCLLPKHSWYQIC